MNLAMKLTFFRIAVVPFFVYMLYLNTFSARIAALLLFSLGMISDAYDGYFARKRNEITVLGSFLDPLADKLLISSAFISFVGLRELSIPAWMVVVIISRDFLITGLRSVGASKNVVIPADRAGKFKTTSQSVAVIVILLILVLKSYAKNRIEASPIWLNYLNPLPFILVFSVTLLTFYSGAKYLARYKSLLK